MAGFAKNVKRDDVFLKDVIPLYKSPNLKIPQSAVKLYGFTTGAFTSW